jgi:hypothetical protein
MCAQVLSVKTFRTNGLLSPLISLDAIAHTMPCDHGCYLNDRVDIRLWKDAFASRTFNVKAEDAHGCDIRVFPVGSVRDQVFVAVVSEAQTGLTGN